MASPPGVAAVITLKAPCAASRKKNVAPTGKREFTNPVVKSKIKAESPPCLAFSVDRKDRETTRSLTGEMALFAIVLRFAAFYVSAGRIAAVQVPL